MGAAEEIKTKISSMEWLIIVKLIAFVNRASGALLQKEVPVSFYGFALSLKGEHYDRLIHL